MKYEEYLSLIQGLENYARSHRKLYEYKVVGLTFLGYGYIVALLALFLSIPTILLISFIIEPEIIGRLLLLMVKLWWLIIPGLGLFFWIRRRCIECNIRQGAYAEGSETIQEAST